MRHSCLTQFGRCCFNQVVHLEGGINFGAENGTWYVIRQFPLYIFWRTFAYYCCSIQLANKTGELISEVLETIRTSTTALAYLGCEKRRICNGAKTQVVLESIDLENSIKRPSARYTFHGDG